MSETLDEMCADELIKRNEIIKASIMKFERELINKPTKMVKVAKRIFNWRLNILKKPLGKKMINLLDLIYQEFIILELELIQM